MDRLTFKKEFQNPGEEVNCACIDMHTYNRVVNEKEEHYYLAGEVIDKLADYEDKQEQGLLIELPCKVGDTVYLADKIHGKVEVSIVEHIEYIVNTNANFPFTKIKGECFCIFFDDFGKLAFLTRSEAEEALAKMGGK